MKACLVVLLMFVVAPLAGAAEACAHRGDVKVAPENTLPAFVSAVEKEAAQIEFDVQLSKDGHLVLMHDTTVDRTTNGTGNVGDLTFAELRALDAGSWFGETFSGTQIPTLRETLEVIPPAILCNVHLKNSPGVAAAAAKEVAAMGRLDHCFLACTIEQAQEAKAVAPEIRVCNMSRQVGGVEAYAASTIAHGAEFIQLHQGTKPENLRDLVERLHGAGVRVNYFGADDPPTIQALALAGVDYILTDDLDTCMQTLQALKPQP